MNFPPRDAGSGKRFRWIGGNFMVTLQADTKSVCLHGMGLARTLQPGMGEAFA
jgi:hypothetical protein